MTELRSIFVFGSNLAGRHGAGSARHAMKHCGAVWGVGMGPTGSSYAIPTKDAKLKTLSLPQIREHVKDFIKYARANPDLTFEIVEIGCGLAGYFVPDIAPMFRNAPSNCNLPEAFKKELGQK